MSLFKSIGKALSGVVKPIIGIGKNILGGALSTATGGLLGGGAAAMPTPISFPAPLPAGGPPMTLPQSMPGGATISGQLGQMLGRAIAPGGPGAVRMKRGRLTGAAIPVGFQERMSKNGVVYLSRAARRRGISGRDVAAFRRVNRLLASVRERPFHARRRK